MSELVEIVGSLENKISKLLHRVEQLQQAKLRLEEEVVVVQKDHTETKNSLIIWEDKYNSLKMASSMLGSNTNKTEAKLKINTLIRDLDHCITQLSE
jgi:phage shock protein A